MECPVHYIIFQMISVNNSPLKERMHMVCCSVEVPKSIAAAVVGNLRIKDVAAGMMFSLQVEPAPHLLSP